jgi:hypothetical protein
MGSLFVLWCILYIRRPTHHHPLNIDNAGTVRAAMTFIILIWFWSAPDYSSASLQNYAGARDWPAKTTWTINNEPAGLMPHSTLMHCVLPTAVKQGSAGLRRPRCRSSEYAWLARSPLHTVASRTIRIRLNVKIGVQIMPSRQRFVEEQSTRIRASCILFTASRVSSSCLQKMKQGVWINDTSGLVCSENRLIVFWGQSEQFWSAHVCFWWNWSSHVRLNKQR